MNYQKWGFFSKVNNDDGILRGWREADSFMSSGAYKKYNSETLNKKRFRERFE